MLRPRTLAALIGALTLTSWGCQPNMTSGGHGHDHGAHGGHEEHEGGHAPHGPEPLSRTSFTDQTELFVEFPPFVVGERSRFAAHLTHLKTFAPVTEGRMVVELEGSGGTQRFEVIKPAQEGIFRPVVIPGRSGPHRVKVTWETEAGRDVHDLGTFEVYADADAAGQAGGGGQEGNITLLKEQQWTLDFSTAAVEEGEVKPSLLVYGAVQASQGRELSLRAPAAGRVIELVEGYRRGMKVTRGQLLARIAPTPQPEVDAPALQADLRQARLNLTHARTERERLEGLLAKGAIPRRRLEEAVHQEESARVALSEATQRLRLNRRSVGSAGEVVHLTAPTDGVLVEVRVAEGQSLEAGAVLLTFLDSGSLWIEARVPEFDLSRVPPPYAGWVELADGRRLELTPEQAIGTVGPVDPHTRTAPLRFSVTPQDGLHLGASVQVHLYSGPAVSGHIVPKEAILREGGQDIVFVQRTGESFERRAVRLSAYDKDNILVEAGVVGGERVVRRGAYLVKLAASSTAVPNHGHAH
ncbi:MAG: efflux transporter periplasmic adaptor subunit [Myxococcales bacterium]|nr:efflux transporter periplasmic adaptor subunit [Myxococcales bacterium]